MHISKCLQSLIGNVPHFLMGKFSLFLLELIDISIEVLKHKVELILLLNEFKELDYVGVVQFDEYADLVEVDALIPVLILPLHALDRHHLSCLLVYALGHAAKAAIAQLAAHLVLLHSNQYDISFIFNFFGIEAVKMDPTKPILDLYSDNNYNNPRSSYRTVKSPTINNNKYNRPPPQKEISYTELKEKYQELYHAYSQKVQKVNSYEEQLTNIREENQRLKEQLFRLQDKNQQLNATLLNKNVELQQAYKQLQEDIRRGNKNKRNDQALERLEEGLREAITSNFNLLRQATLSQLKQF